MKKLIDLDPDVMQLYQDLVNGRYKDCDDYLVNPVESCYTPPEVKQRELEIYFDGEKINDYFNSEDIDYGL